MVSQADQQWNAYFVAAITSLFYGLLIGVQDTLDNPFNILMTEGGTMTIRTHVDAVDLSRLEFYPYTTFVS